MRQAGDAQLKRSTRCATRAIAADHGPASRPRDRLRTTCTSSTAAYANKSLQEYCRPLLENCVRPLNVPGSLTGVAPLATESVELEHARQDAYVHVDRAVGETSVVPRLLQRGDRGGRHRRPGPTYRSATVATARVRHRLQRDCRLPHGRHRNPTTPGLCTVSCRC